MGHANWACGGEGRKRGEKVGWWEKREREAGMGRLVAGPEWGRGVLFHFPICNPSFKHDPSQIQMGFQTHFSIQKK